MCFMIFHRFVFVSAFALICVFLFGFALFMVLFCLFVCFVSFNFVWFVVVLFDSLGVS